MMTKTYLWMLILFLGLVGSNSSMNAQMISKEHALADIDEFEGLMANKSSYMHLARYDFNPALAQLRKEVEGRDSVAVKTILHALQNIIRHIGDRHAAVRLGSSRSIRKTFLPFAVAPHEGKAIALKKHRGDIFSILYPDYPYLKAINSVPLLTFIDRFNWRHCTAPEPSHLLRGLEELRSLEEQLERLGYEETKSASFTFTNGERDTIIQLPLSQRRGSWGDIGDINDQTKREYKKGNFDSLFRELEGGIAYMALPKMFNSQRTPTILGLLRAKMEEYRSSKALIIDLRGNGGGSREILDLLAPYFCTPGEAPRVVNVAYVRTDDKAAVDVENMDYRYLYNYDAPELTDADRKAIDLFLPTFVPKRTFDDNKFSAPFYMVISHEKGKNHYHYKQPVYVLINEQCFSAAGVFASVIKGLPNVKLVGVNTDGSSGLSRNSYLQHSNIRVRLSTMISYQRDGTVLDGTGTAPDIVIPRTMAQIKGEEDSQLKHLIELINEGG